MAGGFMLTEYAPALEDYFEIDKEIVCFENAAEMVDKINYYLNHDEERRAIARAGWERAINEHTSSHMVAKVFAEIEEETLTHGNKKISFTQKQKTPIRIRKLASVYHCWWARTLMEEDYDRFLWKDELALSLSYCPFTISAWCFRVISFMPASLVPVFLKLFQATEKPRVAMRTWLTKLSKKKRLKNWGNRFASEIPHNRLR